MKLNTGMRCHDICPKMEMEQVFEQVKMLGVSNIQLALGKSIAGYDFGPGHFTPGLGHRISRLLQENGIHVTVLGCVINPANPDEEARKNAVRRFTEHMKYARILGADLIGTETGRMDAEGKFTAATYTEEAYQLFCRTMAAITEAAEDLGVIVGLEGGYNHVLHTPERMRRFLREIASPNVEVIFDPMNLIHPDETDRESQKRILDKAFSWYGDRITVLHVKDVAFEGEKQVFHFVGEGVFDYEPLLRWVKEEKPQIDLLLESCVPERYHGDADFLKNLYDHLK